MSLLREINFYWWKSEHKVIPVWELYISPFITLCKWPNTCPWVEMKKTRYCGYQLAEQMFRDQSSTSDPINNFPCDPVQVVLVFWTIALWFPKLGLKHLLSQTAIWHSNETIYGLDLCENKAPYKQNTWSRKGVIKLWHTGQILSATYFCKEILLE